MLKRLTAFKLIISILFISIYSTCIAVASSNSKHFVLDSIYASLTIPKEFSTILTLDNLDENSSWIVTKGKDMDKIKKDFNTRDILLQAWNDEMDVCLEIIASKDQLADKYFDIDAQSPQIRSIYRKDHLESDIFPGHTYDSAEWQSNKKIGRFLMLKYSHRDNNEVTHRGFSRRTIRNGFTITVDVMVFGRKLRGADNNTLNKVMESWSFVEILPLPDENAANMIIYTQAPPNETNTGKFTVKGAAQPSSRVVAHVASWTRPDQILFETVANKEGNFTIDIELPFESLYVISLTVLTDKATYENLLVHTLTYDKSILPVSFEGSFADALSSPDTTFYTNEDKVVMEGLTIQSTKIQLMYDGNNIKKTVGANGKFSFNIPTKEEREYDITVSFNVKNMSERRFRFTVTRNFTQKQRISSIKQEAIRPSYSNLKNKITAYTGRKMVYNLFPVSMEIADDGNWLAKFAFRSLKDGYKDIIYIDFENEPSFAIGTEVKVYLECLGSISIEENSYPHFKFLFSE